MHLEISENAFVVNGRYRIRANGSIEFSPLNVGNVDDAKSLRITLLVVSVCLPEWYTSTLSLIILQPPLCHLLSVLAQDMVCVVTYTVTMTPRLLAQTKK